MKITFEVPDTTFGGTFFYMFTEPPHIPNYICGGSYCLTTEKLEMAKRGETIIMDKGEKNENTNKK